MPVDKPLLSICIPTYNRDYLIDRMLEGLTPIALRLGIPILISDNSSPDGTGKIIEKYQKQYNGIKYIKQPRNIGPDRNFEFLLRNADSHYVWLLGDSAYIDIEEMQRLLEFLSKNECEFVVLGAEKRTDALESKIYTDPNLLLSEIGWHMTYVSCLIYNKNVIDKCNFGRYYDSHFLQSGAIFEYIAGKAFKVAMLNYVKVNTIPGTKRDHWWNNALEIFCRDWYLFVMSLPISYSYESKKKCLMAHGRFSHLFSLKSLLYMRAMGGLSFPALNANRFFIKQTVNKPLAILFALCCVPRRILKLGLKLCESLGIMVNG